MGRAFLEARMKDEMQRLSDANYEIMRVLWEAGEATVQAITNILNWGMQLPPVTPRACVSN